MKTDEYDIPQIQIQESAANEFQGKTCTYHHLVVPGDVLTSQILNKSLVYPGRRPNESMSRQPESLSVMYGKSMGFKVKDKVKQQQT